VLIDRHINQLKSQINTLYFIYPIHVHVHPLYTHTRMHRLSLSYTSICFKQSPRCLCITLPSYPILPHSSAVSKSTSTLSLLPHEIYTFTQYKHCTGTTDPIVSEFNIIFPHSLLCNFYPLCSTSHAIARLASHTYFTRPSLTCTFSHTLSFLFAYPLQGGCTTTIGYELTQLTNTLPPCLFPWSSEVLSEFFVAACFGIVSFAALLDLHCPAGRSNNS
jgi:hypothetical protein